MKKVFGIFVMLAGLISGTAVLAQKPAVVADSDPGWHRIAGLQANFDKQSESVEIMGNDEFKAIRFRVDDAPIHIERMQVFYESGDMEDVDVKSEMKAGETSKTFQLKHAGRDISKIAFTYNTIGNDNSKKAELEIYGLKTGTPSDAYDKKADKVEGDLNEAKDDAKQEARETENDIEKAAEKTGDKIDEAATKTAAEIDDRRHDTKVGPDGQVIYISDDNRYYYVNEQGDKVFVTEMQLKDK